jgi:hypothetical protein
LSLLVVVVAVVVAVVAALVDIEHLQALLAAGHLLKA